MSIKTISVADNLEESLPTLQRRLYISIGAGNQHGYSVSYYSVSYYSVSYYSVSYYGA